jgi:hypothetical protein
MVSTPKKLSRTALDDLIHLAGERALDTVSNVTQLIDDDKQRFTVMAAASVYLIGLAAHTMQQGMAKQNGSEPDMKDCIGNVLVHVANLSGLESKVVTLPEKKKK